MTMGDTIERNLAIVRGVYEAFGRGDAASIMKTVADDVDWDFAYTADSPIPWLRRGTGPAAVSRFFETLGRMLEVRRFAIRELLASGSTVVVIFDIEGVVRDTGKVIEEVEETHIWHFNDAGEVIRFRHNADTLQQYLALQPA